MNPHFRLAALIAAALGLVVSLFIALSPDGDDPAATTAPPAATSAPETLPTEPETETEPAPAGTTSGQGPGTIRIDYVIEGGAPKGGIARDSVARGRIVVLRVTADVTDHVHLHGYDLTADVAPGAPATIRFTADVPGRFEVELEESGVEFAELEVRP